MLSVLDSDLQVDSVLDPESGAYLYEPSGLVVALEQMIAAVGQRGGAEGREGLRMMTASTSSSDSGDSGGA